MDYQKLKRMSAQDIKDLIEEVLCFWHLLSMDGLEISYMAMCPTNDCPICECPRDELDRTDTTYEVRSGEKIKSMVKAAQAELLNPDGIIKNRCKTKVSMY
jgi:hypothetical protein